MMGGEGLGESIRNGRSIDRSIGRSIDWIFLSQHFWALSSSTFCFLPSINSLSLVVYLEGEKKGKTPTKE